jgi:hypothetical protein
MFPIRLRRASTAVAAAACAVVLVGLVASDAAADGRKWKGRGHRHHRDRSDNVVRVVERPIYPRFSFVYGRPAPTWCRDASYVVFDGDPYWYHVGLGAFFSGVDVNVDIGNAPPRGYGYWDPECGEWFGDVRAYSTHCKRHGHRPMLQVAVIHDDHSNGCDCCHDHDDDGYDWR